jgi:predicted trehalose synthase
MFNNTTPRYYIVEYRLDVMEATMQMSIRFVGRGIKDAVVTGVHPDVEKIESLRRAEASDRAVDLVSGFFGRLGADSVDKKK